MKDIRKFWVDRRNSLVEKAEAIKDSQSVSFGLIDTYDGLTDYERAVVNDIIAEWLMSDDNTLRYDAGFLISQRCIKSMKGTVEQAILSAQHRVGPEAEFEVKKLRRILSELSLVEYQAKVKKK
jgi:hypothetical protein